MPFEKGKSGNPSGRPKGAANKVNEEIRNRIASFLDENFDLLQSDLRELEPRERVKFYIDLLQYGLPKLKTVELTKDPDFDPDKIDLSKLSTETLLRISNELHNSKHPTI